MSFEAFTLLTLPSATLTSNGVTQSGPFELECVSLAVERGKDVHDHNGPSPHELYLIVRLRDVERPIDPSRPINFSASNAGRSYVFVTADGSIATLVLPPPREQLVIEDQDTFHGVLAQYAELIQPGEAHFGEASDGMVSHEAPRGRLVFVDEDNGEVVGELDHNLRIHEDPALGNRGAENDPVVIEIEDETSQEMFAHLIPPEDRDWITQSAYLASHIISGTTKLLLTTITTASSYYIGHSTPHTLGSSSNDGSTPTPPRALVFLTSENTKKGLSTVHAMSTQAAIVSQKTVSLLDQMIKRTMGKTRAATSSPVPGQPLPATRYPVPGSPSLSYHEPPLYTPAKTSGTLKPPLPPRSISPQSSRNAYTSMDTKPRLPPRKDGSLSPQPPASASAQQSSGSHPPLKMRYRLLLSADLILSTMDSSMRQVVSIGGEALGRAVEHKYGPEAARSAGLLTGTAKNIVAVYIDMRGFGRRAIIKRVGKEYVRSRVPASSRPRVR
jgi:spartin